MLGVDRDGQVATEQADGVDFVLQPFSEGDGRKMRFWGFPLETGISQAGVDQVVEFTLPLKF